MGSKFIAAIALGALLLPMGLAQAEDVTPAAPDAAPQPAVVGLWQPPDKLSDYEIRICDDATQAICLKVKALRGKAVKPKYTAYLGKDIVEMAKPDGAGRWRGKLHLFGQEADGTLTMQGQDSMKIEGCAFVVLCDDVILTRVVE